MTTTTDARALVLDALAQIAPDVDIEAVADNDRLQDDLELDSMDVLNLMVALSERIGSDIPEDDYRQLATIGGATDYLAARIATP
jgi:acyl carrier protein